MKTILVLTDFSERSVHAAEYACHLAGRLNAEVLLYNAFEVSQAIAVEGGVFPPYFDDITRYEQKSSDQLRALAEQLKLKFEEGDYPVISFKNGLGTPGENFRQIQEKKKIWLTVIGDKLSDNFFSQMVFGSDSNQIISRAACPVLIVPEATYFRQFRQIALAVSAFDRYDLKALSFLTEISQRDNGKIIVTHVVSKNATDEEVEKHAQSFKQERATITYPKITYFTIREDDVTAALQNFVRLADLEMLALVNKKHPFYERLFRESKIKNMMLYHKIPLLVFPAHN